MGLGTTCCCVDKERGACCLPDGSCVDVVGDTPQGTCEQIEGGVYQGDDTACVFLKCPGNLPLQACCFPDGSCQDTAAPRCVARGGDPQGVGTRCADTSCLDCPQYTSVPDTMSVEFNFSLNPDQNFVEGFGLYQLLLPGDSAHIPVGDVPGMINGFHTLQVDRTLPDICNYEKFFSVGNGGVPFEGFMDFSITLTGSPETIDFDGTVTSARWILGLSLSSTYPGSEFDRGESETYSFVGPIVNGRLNTAAAASLPFSRGNRFWDAGISQHTIMVTGPAEVRP